MKEEFANLGKYVPFLKKRPGLRTAIESFCGITQVRRFFRESAQDENPFAGVARRAGVGIRFIGEEIPREGPVVIVANHAYGGPDAVAMSAKAIEVRDDVKILANAELMNLEGVADYFLPVSLLQEGSAAQENTASLRGMLKHVRSGGCLVVFPAGQVSIWREGGMQDPPWNTHVVSLIQRMQATIVPVWFYGSNPAWVKLLSHCSVMLKRALIPRGFVAMQGREIVARVGKSFSSSDLKDFGPSANVWLRKRLERLVEFGN